MTTHYEGCYDSGPKHYECALLEVKRMEFKPEKSLQEPVAWLVTYGGLTHVAYTQPTQVVDTHYQPLNSQEIK
jgi:hypothetical protein